MTSDFKPKRTEQSRRPQLSTEEWMAKKQAEKEEVYTYATRLCEAGINIKVIQDVLGHSDIDTTMNIYVDVTSELKKKEILTFDSFMEEQGVSNESA